MVDNGISPKCVCSICEKYDIAHYAFDVKKNCFIKNISKSRNHKAMVYFAVNNHMYHMQYLNYDIIGMILTMISY